jgi:hypothetical protein
VDAREGGALRTPQKFPPNSSHGVGIVLATARLRRWSMAATRAARTAVVVTNFPERDALDMLLGYPGIDVAVFERPATAYGCIKREQPAIVILDLPFETATEFALLTMLKLDRETAGIPIWTGSSSS